MERRVKNNRYKNGGNSKQDWISHKIGILIKEGYPKDQASAISYSMYEQEHKQNGGYNYQKTGDKNITPTDVANINQSTGIQFTPEFATDYFSQQSVPIAPTQQTPSDFTTTPVKDITSDGMFTNRKIWYTDRAENFLGKNKPVQGKDYQVIPYSQWETYQTSPAYLQYQNQGQGGIASMQIGGNFTAPNNIGYNPQPITLQPQTNQFDSTNYNQYSQNLQQQYPLPNTKVDGFTYNPNELSPYSQPPQITAPNTYNVDTGSEYIQGDNNLDGVVNEQDQFDKFGQPVNSQQQGTNTAENFSYFNPYGGFDIPSAAYKLGQGIETGNAFDIGVSSLKLATGLGRNLVSGMGTANRRENILQDYQQKARQASRPVAQGLQNGGYFQTGGQMVGQQAPENDIVSQVTSALQSGMAPQLLLQQLVESGVTQQEAIDLIQRVLQQLQEGQSQQQDSQEEVVMQMGGTYLKKLKGKKIKNYTLNTVTNNYEVEYE